MSDYRIVYSSDGSHLKDPKDAQNEPAIVPSEIELHLKRGKQRSWWQMGYRDHEFSSG
jgi:hypothetical protein